MSALPNASAFSDASGAFTLREENRDQNPIVNKEFPITWIWKPDFPSERIALRLFLQSPSVMITGLGVVTFRE
jgi:hypothetical protein